MNRSLHPVLTCSESQSWEKDLLGDDNQSAWKAMNRAGRALGDAIMDDFCERMPFPQRPRMLLLCGKGHNAGDAILAADQILRECPLGEAHILLVEPESALKENVARALENIQDIAKVVLYEKQQLDKIIPQHFHICLDGLLGMSFKAPLREPYNCVIEAINKMDRIDLRVAVDLPSGLGDASTSMSFNANFTYATGIAKKALFESKHAKTVGRVRYLDIGFFDEKKPSSSDTNILQPSILRPLQNLRAGQSDKRSYGHAFILAGSKHMPGALLMSVQAALRSGAGRVTAFVPESIASVFAAQAPEAMWIPWPETPEGGLSLEGLYLLRQYEQYMDALLMGPGMGTEPETMALVQDIVKNIDMPLVLDADALQLEIISALIERSKSAGAVCVTPHLGELRRMTNNPELQSDDWDTLKQYAMHYNFNLLLKGNPTRLTSGTEAIIHHRGGPVLARGGSGDILSGLIAGLIAHTPDEPLEVLCRAAMWQGVAADLMARDYGHTSAVATDLMPYLHKALRREV